MIKAIETKYNGYKFRSRQEARWAVFFDALEIPYRYEPEGYNLGNVCYLPDFWLPEHGWYFEVKGKFAAADEMDKAALLAQKSHKPVIISWANFDIDTAWDSITFWHDENEVFHSQERYAWHICTSCGDALLLPQKQLVTDDAGVPIGSEWTTFYCSVCSKRWARFAYNDPVIIEAYKDARAMRFDKGGN